MADSHMAKAKHAPFDFETFWMDNWSMFRQLHPFDLKELSLFSSNRRQELQVVDKDKPNDQRSILLSNVRIWADTKDPTKFTLRRFGAILTLELITRYKEGLLDLLDIQVPLAITTGIPRTPEFAIEYLCCAPGVEFLFCIIPVEVVTVCLYRALRSSDLHLPSAVSSLKPLVTQKRDSMSVIDWCKVEENQSKIKHRYVDLLVATGGKIYCEQDDGFDKEEFLAENPPGTWFGDMMTAIYGSRLERFPAKPKLSLIQKEKLRHDNALKETETAPTALSENAKGTHKIDQRARDLLKLLITLVSEAVNEAGF